MRSRRNKPPPPTLIDTAQSSTNKPGHQLATSDCYIVAGNQEPPDNTNISFPFYSF